MNYEINMEDKKYIYVISYYTPSNDLIRTIYMNTDISIFEINEWNDLLDKNEIFKKWVNILNCESDNGYIKIDPEIRSAAYYIYYNCDYCKYDDFTSLEYYSGNKQDIYERVFLEVKNTDRTNVSVNNFRKWISDNYEKLNKNYNIIKMYDNQ
jgi:hypothetical protein